MNRRKILLSVGDESFFYEDVHGLLSQLVGDSEGVIKSFGAI